MKIPEITLSGSPYEIGFKHGKELKPQVWVSLETYRERYLRQRQLSWEDAKRLSLRFLPAFEGENERFIEEMRGIADGAGLTFEDILAINLRSEILYTGLVNAFKQEADECTALAILPPRTARGQVIAGQSWDFTLRQKDASAIVRYRQGNGRSDMLVFLEAGMLGGKGVNRDGICLTLNALTTSNTAVGLPLHARMRLALEKKYLSDAYVAAVSGKIPVSVCLTITSRDGLALCLELDPAGADVLQPENGFIAHTNHFVGIKHAPTHANAGLGSTYMRYQRIRQQLSQNSDIRLEQAESFMRDHKGYPTSICAHPHPDTPEEELPRAGGTICAFLTELTTGRTRFCMGNPCENEFEDVGL
ncbi:MAG: C45 family peptidase [Clostridiales bacterium]|nr:C45 family peptidase [Clostridiales bacterium]